VAPRRGRRPKLTEELQQRILVAVRAGVGVEESFRLAGIGVRTGHEWLRRGEGTDPRRPTAPQFAQFAQSLKKAQAEDEAARIARINAAGRGGAIIYTRTLTTKKGETISETRTTAPQWQADAWYLERKHPERWALRHRLEHSGPDGGPIDVHTTGYDLSLLSEEELETFLALARKATPRPTRRRP
jgi:hypothetical protein